MAANPDVKIVERGTGTNLDEYSPKLTQWLAAGKGAGDVVAIEEGPDGRVQGQPRQLRQPARPRRRRPQGQLPRLEVERRA